MTGFQSKMTENKETQPQSGENGDEKAPGQIKISAQAPGPQTPGPETPEGGQGQKPEKSIEKRVRTAQNFILAGSIVGLIAWFAGGLVFGVVGLVLSIVGLRKEQAIEKENPSLKQQLKYVKNSGIFAIVICVTALIYVAIMLVYLYPYLVEFLETGDFSSLYSAGDVSESLPETNETWG